MSAAASSPGSHGRHADARVARVVQFFEQLSPGALAQLDRIYTADAQFKDPFNEVQGLRPIRRIFEHMYAELAEPRFVVQEAVASGDDGFLTWEFHFLAPRLGPLRQVIRGATHLRFDSPSGLVCLHRDYWDAAEELYAKLPLLGALMRWLRRRGQVT